MSGSFLLVSALVIDAFIACFAYGISRIRIPFCSGLLIAAVGTAALALSGFAAKGLEFLLNPALCRYLSFFLLLTIGILSLFQSLLKQHLRQRKQMRRHPPILAVYLDETAADADRSRCLNLSEALLLGITLSLDSIAAGIGSGLYDRYLPFTLALCFFFHLLAIWLGQLLGQRATGGKRLPHADWLSGSLLILLAFLRLF